MFIILIKCIVILKSTHLFVLSVFFIIIILKLCYLLQFIFIKSITLGNVPAAILLKIKIIYSKFTKISVSIKNDEYSRLMT